MRLSRSKLFVCFVTLGIVAFPIVLSHSDSDPRWADEVLRTDEMHWNELLVFALGIGSMFGGWIAAVVDSFALDHRGWRWWNLFPPVFLVYLWVSATGVLQDKRDYAAA